MSITASFGGATRRPADGLDLTQLRAWANEPLHRAKESGRNRVVWEGDAGGA